MAHQYMPKIFDGPHRNPVGPPSYILNVRSLNIRKQKPCKNFNIFKIEKQP